MNILDISMIQLHLLPDLGLHRGLREARSFQGCDIPQDLKPELDKKPLLIELGEGSMRSIKGKCCYRAMRAAFDELPWPQKTRRHDGHYALSRACRWVIELTETPTLETGRSSREPYPTRGRVHTLGKEWRSTVAGLKNRQCVLSWGEAAEWATRGFSRSSPRVRSGREPNSTCSTGSRRCPPSLRGRQRSGSAA